MDSKPTEVLVDLVQRGALAQVAYVAAELRIADHLGGSPMAVDRLAETTGCHAPSLHRLMRALAALGLCVERDDGAFALSRAGGYLRSDVADSLHAWVLWFGRNQWSIWGQLMQTVRTGESARKRTTGADGFELFERSPETAAIFNAAMVELTRLVAQSIGQACDFTDARTIVDVGGGQGALLEALLNANSGLRGVLIDRAHAIDGARALLSRAGVAHRCEFVLGDFFESVPAGADIYLLKNIIHDWNDERALQVLRNCHDAMPGTGRLLLIERVLPARIRVCASHQTVTHADLTMMLGPGGQERNEGAFRELLRLSGFELAGIKPIALGYSILEATKMREWPIAGPGGAVRPRAAARSRRSSS
jgi:hypothetical protein